MLAARPMLASRPKLASRPGVPGCGMGSPSLVKPSPVRTAVVTPAKRPAPWTPSELWAPLREDPQPKYRTGKRMFAASLAYGVFVWAPATSYLSWLIRQPRPMEQLVLNYREAKKSGNAELVRFYADKILTYGDAPTNKAPPPAA